MAQYKIEGICVTCLSVGRRLLPVQCVSVLGFNLSVAGCLCWECQAMITKMVAFQKKVLAAQQMLTMFGNREGVINIQSLSTLSCRQLYTFNTDIFKEKVKEEIDSESESNDNNINDQEIDSKLFIQKEKLVVLQNPTEIKIEPMHDPLKVEVVEGTSIESAKDTDIKRETVEIDMEKCKTKILTSLDEVEKIRQEDLVSNRYIKAPHKCETCIISYNNRRHLERHRSELHSEKYLHECKICQQRFDSNQSKEKHYKDHFTCYECLQCSYSHTRYDVVLKHYTEVHNGVGHQWQCEECQIVFDTYRKMKYHTETRHSKLPQCNECGKIVSSKSTLQNHMKKHQNVIWEEKCPICEKKISIKKKYEMRKHIATHDGPHGARRHSEKKQDKTYYCEVCQKEFKKLNLYQNHLRYTMAHVQPETMKFECHDCGKRFCMKNKILDHILAHHSKNADFVCQVCSKAFKTNRRLTDHFRKHSGRKPVRDKVCEQCGKAFFKSKTLAEHLNVHTGARPYECAVCGDTFAYNAALYTHNRLKHLGLKRKQKMQ